MSRKVIISAVAAVLVLSGVFVWWLVSSQGPSSTEGSIVSSPEVISDREIDLSVPPSNQPANPPPIPLINLKNSALRFAEIYGSYSSDAPFVNLKLAEDLASSSFRQSLQAAAATTPTEAGYYSVTTRALSATIDSQTNERAVVSVDTQREEIFSREGEPQLRYQTIKLTLVKQDDQWLVEAAEWK